MIVVSVVAMMAALGAPSVIRLMQDRRSQREALELLGVLQDGHSRAFGRGAAVIVTFNEGGPSGVDTINLRESLQDIDGVAPAGDLPSPSCSSPTSSGVLKFWQSSDRDRPTDIRLHLNGQAGILEVPASTSQAMCFTPRGNTRVLGAGGWVNMNDVAQFTFTSGDSGNSRFVYLYPNGIARLRI